MLTTVLSKSEANGENGMKNSVSPIFSSFGLRPCAFLSFHGPAFVFLAIRPLRAAPLSVWAGSCRWLWALWRRPSQANYLMRPVVDFFRRIDVVRH